MNNIGITSFIEGIGNTFIRLTAKILLVIIGIAIVLAFVKGVQMYWPFAVGIIGGMAVSPFLYMIIADAFEGDLPGVLEFNLLDVGDALFMGRERLDEYAKELTEKEEEARKVVAHMDEELTDIQVEYKKAKTKMKTDLYKDVKGVHYTSRMKKTMKMQAKEDNLNRHMSKKNRKIDWEKFV